MQLCTNLEIPLASKMIEGPSTCLTLFTLVTAHVEFRLLQDKLLRIKESLSRQLLKKIARNREILPIVGLFQHAKSSYNADELLW